MLSLKKSISSILIIALLLPNAFIFAQNDIDVLKLKNGDIIKGRIIENKINKHIRIELQGGSILTYEYEKIIEIEREKPKLTLANETIQETSPPNSLSDSQIIYTARLQAKEDWQYKLFGSTTSGEWLAFGGTFIFAFLFSPLIGGSLGMIASSASKVNAIILPSRLQSVDYNNMNAQQKEVYNMSYKEEAEKHLKSRNFISSASGCITAWSLLISMISDTDY